MHTLYGLGRCPLTSIETLLVFVVGLSAPLIQWYITSSLITLPVPC